MANMTPGTDEATVHLVTGTKGVAHITSADDGAMHAATIGTMSAMGQEASMQYTRGLLLLQSPDGTYPSITVTNRTVTLSSGAVMLDGRYIRWDTPLSWDIPYPPSGTDTLYYAIAIKYDRDASGIESAAITMIPAENGGLVGVKWGEALPGYDNRITTTSTTSTVRMLGTVQGYSSYVQGAMMARRMWPLDMTQGMLMTDSLTADEINAIPGYVGQRLLNLNEGTPSEYVCMRAGSYSNPANWVKRGAQWSANEIKALMTESIQYPSEWSVTIDDAQIAGHRVFIDLTMTTLLPVSNGSRLYTMSNYGSLRPEVPAYAPAWIETVGTVPDDGVVKSIDPTISSWAVTIENTGSYPDGVELSLTKTDLKSNTSATVSSLGEGAVLHAQLSWHIPEGYIPD